VLPSAQEELPYEDWAKLVGGLMDDTPLGRVVAIRSEKDRKIIAQMTSWQRRIRSEWTAFQAQKLAPKDPQETCAVLEGLEKMFTQMFGPDRGA
jgi:hypothetical protein